jgi:ABC-type xylose transport system permease subunit
MFLTLLAVTLLLSAIVAWAVSRAFSQPIERILSRIIADSISAAWVRYMKFAILVVGISSGVRIHELERYITAPQWSEKAKIIVLTPERWVLEVYRTVIETLQGIAWMLLAFFVVALLAYVMVRLSELKRGISVSAATSSAGSSDEPK